MAKLTQAGGATELLDGDDEPYTPRRWLIPAGGLVLGSYGLTSAVAEARLAPQLDALGSRLEVVEDFIAQEITDYGPQLLVLESGVASLRQNLESESITRTQVDRSFLRRIRLLEQTQSAGGYVTTAEFVTLESRVSSIESVTVPEVAAVRVLAQAAYDSTSVNATDILDLQGQVSALSTSGPVLATRQVLAGTGLTGGGALSADLTLTLANTAVTPSSYTLASVTVDAQGRITSASNGSLAGRFGVGDIAARPTTPSVPTGEMAAWFAFDTGKFSIWNESTTAWVDIN